MSAPNYDSSSGPEGSYGGLRTSRRQFLSLLVFVLLHPRIVWATDADNALRTDRAVVTALVGFFLPPYSAHPGGLALGIDARINGVLHRGGKSNKMLRMVSHNLGGSEFVAMGIKARAERIRSHLDGSPISTPLRKFLYICTQEYFTDARSWGPLGYRTPQPLGYPDYASCKTANGAPVTGG